MADERIVHVIDDDEAIRASLAFLLDSAGMTVRTYESAPQFLADSPNPTGCIITDVRMPEISGLDLMRELAARGVRTPVVVITGHGDVPLAVEAMKAGVIDFLEKPFNDDALLNVIQRAFAQAPAAEPRNVAFSQLLGGLSPREVDVLHGVVAGKANKVIAQDLGISPRTVEVYRAHLMSKTGASSLAALIRMAIASGFVDVD